MELESVASMHFVKVASVGVGRSPTIFVICQVLHSDLRVHGAVVSPDHTLIKVFELSQPSVTLVFLPTISNIGTELTILVDGGLQETLGLAVHHNNNCHLGILQSTGASSESVLQYVCLESGSCSAPVPRDRILGKRSPQSGLRGPGTEAETNAI